jgi:hypothetical protein
VLLKESYENLYFHMTLHIKLGVMQQFVKALNEERDCFKYIRQKFTALTEAKVKEE